PPAPKPGPVLGLGPTEPPHPSGPGDLGTPKPSPQPPAGPQDLGTPKPKPQPPSGPKDLGNPAPDPVVDPAPADPSGSTGSTGSTSNGGHHPGKPSGPDAQDATQDLVPAAPQRNTFAETPAAEVATSTTSPSGVGSLDRATGSSTGHELAWILAGTGLSLTGLVLVAARRRRQAEEA
ncbi:MAG: hypothetical protein ACJ72D_20820, partial [Marmoricola sp.]